MSDEIHGVETDQIQLVHQRIHEAYMVTYADMMRSMYGNMENYVRPILWQRVIRYLQGFPDRARDAWAVLKGDAEIGY